MRVNKNIENPHQNIHETSKFKRQKEAESKGIVDYLKYEYLCENDQQSALMLTWLEHEAARNKICKG